MTLHTFETVWCETIEHATTIVVDIPDDADADKEAELILKAVQIHGKLAPRSTRKGQPHAVETQPLMLEYRLTEWKRKE